MLYMVTSFGWCHAQGRRRLLNAEDLVMLLAGPVLTLAFNTWNFVDILSVSLDLPTIYFLVLVGVELPLCIVVTLP